MADQVPNPLDPIQSLKRPSEREQIEEAHPPQPVLPEDSAVTKSEKLERNGPSADDNTVISDPHEPAAKRVKLNGPEESSKMDPRDKVKGIALVKPE